jgi:hypothetical protein
MRPAAGRFPGAEEAGSKGLGSELLNFDEPEDPANSQRSSKDDSGVGQAYNDQAIWALECAPVVAPLLSEERNLHV